MAEEGPLSQADIDALTSGLLGGGAQPAVDSAAGVEPAVELILEQGGTVLSTLLDRAVGLTLRDTRAAEAASAAEGMDSALVVRLSLEGIAGDIGILVRRE